MKDKIKSLNQLVKLVSSLKKSGKKVVFTNGCFDLLHYGHAKYLEDAGNKGDILIVGVNSDASIKRIKGEKKRKRFIKANRTFYIFCFSFERRIVYDNVKLKFWIKS